MNRVILHCDMDNYYASVECLDKPQLKTCPLAVCGDPDLRHGIVLAKNYIAKKYGVITGETIYQARSKCPDLVILKPDYPKYLKYAKLAREIYSRYSQKIFPYGLDEAWVDISENCCSIEEGKNIADKLRIDIYSSLKLTISIGVSFNYVFSKLASDMNKPDSTTVIPFCNFESIIRNIPAYELLFVGPATRKLLKKLRIITIGDLAKSNSELLKISLGKKGIILHKFANGNDDLFDPSVFAGEEMKSISNTITPPFNITSDRDAGAFIYLLSEAVSARLILHDFKCNRISIVLRYSDLSAINRSITFSVSAQKTDELFRYAFNIYKNNSFDGTEIRSIGLRAEKLIKSANIQVTMFDIIKEDNEFESIELNELIEEIKQRYGKIKFEFNPFDDVGRVI